VVVTAPPRSSTVVVTAVPTARPTARPTATPAPADNTIRKWDRGTRVKKMQQRLSDLGYPVGKVDGTFGNNTEIAVNLFQSAVGAAEHSYMTEKVQRKLYAADAPVYDPYLDLKKGDKGIRVKQMQEALRTRGYDPGKIDGIYGTKTIQAVAAYQQSLGMALAPNEKPGEIASRWLLLNLYTDLPVNPPRPTNPTNPTSPTNLTPTAQPVNPQPVNPTVPPVIPPATQTDLASPSNL
jgi:peptidoglycan hydrolase-like protein with peptidoglycan-binding domain